ncbi:MAG: AIR synthase family protein [Lachnospiraceae bacterium]|nr:AIR synthase family protein [Lachnospiraceae bacterium]
MKVGKVSESILKRSILKQVKTTREEVLLGASIGEDCAAAELEQGEVFVFSTDPITVVSDNIGRLSIDVTINDIASAGAEPVGVLLSCLLPAYIKEHDIQEMMGQVSHRCAELNVQIMGGHTEVTRAVNQPIITVTGIGKVKKERLVRTSGARPGDDIVVTKWIGLEGTSIIAREKKDELLKRFAPDFIEAAEQFDRFLSVVDEAGIAVKHGVHAMHDVTEGGIFGALWDIAEASEIGIEIDLKSIPVKQETIEICNHFDINPYKLISSGSMLIAAEDGYGLVRELEKNGINAAVVGKATEGNDRVLLNNDERRFLTPPETDEIYKVV